MLRNSLSCNRTINAFNSSHCINDY